MIKELVGNDLPLVSVAIPCYNQEQYIAEAIESVLSQDYNNIEIIISDDASSDQTVDIAQRYAKQYPEKVFLHIHKENQGITNNVISMLPRFKGKYIAWFSGDDIFKAGKITKQVEALEASDDIVLCYHNIDVFDSNTNRTLYNYNDPYNGQNPYSGDVVRELILYRCFIGGTSVMMRRNQIPKNSHDKRLPTMSDWLFWLKLAGQGRVIFIPEVLARYRRHDTNVTRDINHKEEVVFYRIVMNELPEYKSTCLYALARMYGIFVFKYLVKGQLKDARICMAGALDVIGQEPRALLFVLGALVTSLIKGVSRSLFKILGSSARP